RQQVRIHARGDLVAAGCDFADLRGLGQRRAQRRQVETRRAAEGDDSVADTRGQLLRAALDGQPAGIDDDDVVGELFGLVDQVRGQHDGDAVAAKLADQVPGRA